MNPNSRRHAGTFFAALLLICAGTASGRDPERETQKRWTVPQMIAMIKEGPDRPTIIHLLRMAGDKSAIPALEEGFAKAKNEVAKKSIAAALVSLGNRDDRYWHYLAGPAQAAVDLNMPFPFVLENGKYAKGKFNPAFLKWVEANKASKDQAAGDALYTYPGAVFFLGLTGDKRAIPILMKGLASDNSILAKRCAQGLAKLRHRPAVDEIAKACKRLPGEGCNSLAETLPYFRLAEADEEARKVLGPDEVAKARKKLDDHGDDAIFNEDSMRKHIVVEKK